MAMTDLTNIRVKVEVHRSEDGIQDPKDDLENCFPIGDTETPKGTFKHVYLYFFNHFSVHTSIIFILL